jgi:hypothetical protein
MEMANYGWLNYRMRIEGTYKGVAWVYEDADNKKSGVFWPDDDGTNYYYWEDGNYSCDCNRSQYLPSELKLQFGITNKCGGAILIDRIIPMDDKSIPTLELNETALGE